MRLNIVVDGFVNAPLAGFYEAKAQQVGAREIVEKLAAVFADGELRAKAVGNSFELEVELDEQKNTP